MLSSSVAQFLAYMIDHIVAQVCALFVSSSSPCLMRTLCDSLRPLHLPHFPSLHSLCLPALPTAFHLPLPSWSWTTTTRTAAQELGPRDNKNSSTTVKRNEFYNSFQTCAQIHSDASSMENSRCKGGSGERIGKL